jgi:phosphatidate cytidylyltransferase
VSVSKGWALRPEALPIVALTLLFLVLWFLFRPGEIASSGHRLGVTITGLFWSVLFMSGLMCLRLMPDGLAWLYLACGLAWGSDTGAYFAGKFLGKRKLYPAVSPKKTWAGAVGGVISATIIAVIIQKIFAAPSIPLEQLLVIAPVGAALGQMGDLCESLIKRSMGVKDSGKIMPGHGGLLDRVDALFFTGTWLFTYAVVILGAQPAWL